MAELRKRKANTTQPSWRPRPLHPDLVYRWHFPPSLKALLKPFSPGASGLLGGEQRLANTLWRQTNDEGWCWVGAEDFLRCQHYCFHYGNGQPNRLIRTVIPPVFRVTFGIELAFPKPGQVAVEAPHLATGPMVNDLFDQR